LERPNAGADDLRLEPIGKLISEISSEEWIEIQRYEASGYAAASFERLRAIVSALDIRIKESVFLDGPPRKLAA